MVGIFGFGLEGALRFLADGAAFDVFFGGGGTKPPRW
jgi:hypothetical protein